MDKVNENVLNDFILQKKVGNEEALFFIDASGQWFYQNSPLPTKFAQLFYSILYFVERVYFLITPVEKVKVSVEAFPVIIIDYEQSPIGTFQVRDQFDFTFNLESISDFTITDDTISCRLERGLTGKLNRSCYYRFINECLLT